MAYDGLNRLTDITPRAGAQGGYSASYRYNAIGNLTSKVEGSSLAYTYSASAGGCSANTPALKPHAASQAGSNSYSYDCNGNMTGRSENGQAYSQSFNRLNQLASVTKGAEVYRYTYDADGQLIRSEIGATVTVYIGNYYEQQGSTITKYYYFNGQRVAMRTGTVPQGTLSYLFGDHLGSTSVAGDSAGSGTSGPETLYYAFGGARAGSGLPTNRRFAGELLEPNSGLYHIGARWYDAYLNRWIQPDSIVPDPYNPQSLNRYAYSYGNALKYTDPSGHAPVCQIPVWDWLQTAWKVAVFVAEHTEITREAKPQPAVNPERQRTAQIASAVAVGGDTVATAFSTIGSGLEIGSAVGTGGPGIAAGLSAYYTVINPIENGASSVSLAATYVSDFASGNSQVSANLRDGFKSVTIGQDSLIGTAAVAAGNLLPFEGVTDTAINVPQLAYDANRAGGNIPTYFEFRWEKGRPWYIKFYLNLPELPSTLDAVPQDNQGADYGQ